MGGEATPHLRAELDLALLAADLADAITSAAYRRDLPVDLKGDGSPVTAADRDAETRIRQEIADRFPGDAILGEEHGSAPTRSRRRWVVDPIDGTRNFVRGIPVWATLIALLVDDEPVLGVVSAPQLGRRWWATHGGGAWVDEGGAVRRIRVSDVDTLAEAALSNSSLAGWEARGLLPGFLELTRRVDRVRGFGDFWSYMLVAEGAVEIAAEPEVELYDLAALHAIVVEAGGTFTALDGRPGPGWGSAVATNGRLHERVRAILLRQPSERVAP